MTALHGAMAASLLRAAIFFLGLGLALAAGQAKAIFSDDEARRAIIELRTRVEALDTRIAELEKNLQTSSRSQLQLLNENERLRAELAQLRGQIEEATQTASTGKTQQKDFYVDLDQRLKQIEPVPIVVDNMTFQVTRGEKTLFDELKEALRNGEFRKAVATAEAFQQNFPSSRLSPDVLLLKGSAFYAEKNFKAAIAARQEFLDRYPNHTARPQAILNLAASQAESGNPNTARGILENLIKSYPNSPVAAEARERIKTLKSSPAPKPAAKSTPSK